MAAAAADEAWRAAQGPVVARATAHFLPKFDNQNEDKRLAGLLDGPRRLLYVSKKHSGSLVMAPPFYSKNSTANEFSRVGCVLLYEHFQAVWPGQGRERFEEWWADAEARGLCYSFECVTPRVLGDHGATPECAYMILTCVSETRAARFLSPAELLGEATAWRLPLNEVWLVPGASADALEKELHRERWQMQDADAGAILDKYLGPGMEPQRFLSHAETQGQVLEGFVLMALETDAAEMSGLVKRYNETMRPFHDAALATARARGAECLDPARGAEFLGKVMRREVEPLNLENTYAEPERGPGKSVPDEQVWAVACDKTQAGPLNSLFKRLRKVYRHSARLQPYLYKGRLQVQVHITNDTVFYGWPLHTNDGTTAPLFRGMVVTFYPAEDGGRADGGEPGEPARKASRRSSTMGDVTAAAAASGGAIQVRILGIAKLKCLNYMWRTFGVRNRLPQLLRRSKADYLRVLKKGFYPPWNIPKEHVEALHNFFSRWADFALALPRDEQERLTKSFLPTLERFLQTTPYPLGRPVGGSGLPAPAAMPAPPERRDLKFLVCNLSGKKLTQVYLESIGLLPDGTTDPARCDGVDATYTVSTAAPNVPAALAYQLVLFVPPDKAALADLPENQRKALEGSYANLKKRHIKRLRKACSGVRFVLNPRGPADWLTALAGTGQEQDEDAGGRASADNAADAPPPGQRPKRVVLLTMGLPPGGGKSSLFESLLKVAEGGGAPGVSFCFRSSDDFKKRQSFEDEFKRCVEGRPPRNPNKPSPKGEPNASAECVVVGFDKNVPNGDGLQRLLGMLSPLSNQFDLRLVCIVPEALAHDTFWARVKARDHKTHIGLAISPSLSEAKAYGIFKKIFFDECDNFLPGAAAAPGARVLDLFTQDLSPAQLDEALTNLARSVYQEALSGTAGASFSDMVDWVDSGAAGTTDGAAVGADSTTGYQRAAPQRARWCCADLSGCNGAHVTLVPPGADGPESKAALAALRPLAGKTVRVRASKYHIATVKGEHERKAKRIALWEVDAVEGLPDDLSLGEQGSILHVTDRASMPYGVKAKDAADVMRQLRGLGKAGQEWCVETESHGLETTATISFYM